MVFISFGKTIRSSLIVATIIKLFPDAHLAKGAEVKYWSTEMLQSFILFNLQMPFTRFSVSLHVPVTKYLLASSSITSGSLTYVRF